MAVSKPNAMSLFDNIKKDYTPADDKKSVEKKKTAVKRSSDKKPAPAKSVPKKEQEMKAATEPEETKEQVDQSPIVNPPKRRGGGKSTPATFYMTPEVLDMIRVASKAYGGNGSLYIRNLIAKDYKENGKTYEALPDILY